MSLQFNWKTEELEVDPGKKPYSTGKYLNVIAHRELGVGYDSVISAAVIIDGSAGSTPAYRWKINAATGEVISRDVVGWYQSGFAPHFYDPTDGGRHWSLDSYYNMYEFDPETWAVTGAAQHSFYPISWASDPSIWLIEPYGLISGRNLAFGRDNNLYHDRFGMYDIQNEERIGWQKSAVGTGTQYVMPISLYDGYIMTTGGIITPVYFEDRSIPGVSFRVGEEVPYAGRAFCIDPVTHSLLMFVVGPDFEPGRSDARVYSFTLRGSPRHVCKPFPLKMPRSNRKVEVASILYSDDGRQIGNWPYGFSEVGAGDVTDKQHTNATNNNGLARLELDTQASGGYSQQITVSAEHEEVVS